MPPLPGEQGQGRCVVKWVFGHNGTVHAHACVCTWVCMCTHTCVSKGPSIMVLRKGRSVDPRIPRLRVRVGETFL